MMMMMMMLCAVDGGEVFVEVVYANTAKAETKSSASTRDGRPPLMPKPQIKFSKKDAASDALPVPEMRRAPDEQHHIQEDHHAQRRLYLQLVDRDSDVSNNCDV